MKLRITIFWELCFSECCYSDICVHVIHRLHRQLINHLGLSTSEVAKESGAGRHLYNWLTGQRTRQTNTLIAGIAAVRWFKQNKYRAPGRTGGGGGEGNHQREKAHGKGKDRNGQDTLGSGGNTRVGQSWGSTYTTGLWIASNSTISTQQKSFYALSEVLTWSSPVISIAPSNASGFHNFGTDISGSTGDLSFNIQDLSDSTQYTVRGFSIFQDTKDTVHTVYTDLSQNFFTHIPPKIDIEGTITDISGMNQEGGLPGMGYALRWVRGVICVVA